MHSQCRNACAPLLQIFFLAPFPSLRSFLFGHRLFLRTFSHAQINRHVQMVVVEDEVFGASDTAYMHLIAYAHNRETREFYNCVGTED